MRIVTCITALALYAACASASAAVLFSPVAPLGETSGGGSSSPDLHSLHRIAAGYSIVTFMIFAAWTVCGTESDTALRSYKDLALPLVVFGSIIPVISIVLIYNSDNKNMDSGYRVTAYADVAYGCLGITTSLVLFVMVMQDLNRMSEDGVLARLQNAEGVKGHESERLLSSVVVVAS